MEDTMDREAGLYDNTPTMSESSKESSGEEKKVKPIFINKSI